MPDLPTPHPKSFVASLARIRFPNLGKVKILLQISNQGDIRILKLIVLGNLEKCLLHSTRVLFGQLSIYLDKDDGGCAFLMRLMWI